MRETLRHKGKREKLPRNARGERGCAGQQQGMKQARGSDSTTHCWLPKRTPSFAAKIKTKGNKKRNSQVGGKGDSAVRKVSTLHVGLSPLFANPGAGAGACSARRSDQSRNGIDGNDRGRPNSKTRHTPPPRDRRAVWSVGAGPKAQTPPLSVACTRRLRDFSAHIFLPQTSLAENKPLETSIKKFTS